MIAALEGMTWNGRASRVFTPRPTERLQFMSQTDSDPRDPPMPGEPPPPVEPEMDPSRAPQTPSYEPPPPQDQAT
jgi:hypothetical protein